MAANTVPRETGPVAMTTSMPSVYVGMLMVDEPEDTYFDMSLWTKVRLQLNLKFYF